MPSHPVDRAKVELVRSAASERKLAYRLTLPEEIVGMLGTPFSETITDHGNRQRRILVWPGVEATFEKIKGDSAPFSLSYMITGGIGDKSIRMDILREFFAGQTVNIGANRPVVLRDQNDLEKFNTFSGFGGVSLVNLNLKSYAELLENTPFDSRTKWPSSDKLPEGFNPVHLLEEGKNPGLGVRRLHEQGINGEGVRIAIIDGTLLQNHREYVQQMVTYEEVGLARVGSPQMHGPAVASIAVGKTCGVASRASLYYYAVEVKWKMDNQPYCDVINKIIEFNKNRDISEQIRVVSISDGGFSRQANVNHWQQTLLKAQQNGLLVVTCDHSDFIIYGTLVRVIGKDPDNPLSYRRGKYSTAIDVLRVPAGNRTIASHHGADMYTFDRTGGMSWAAPYLAGLAALAYQVNPTIKPNTIVDLWIETAIHTNAGPIVNPIGFIEAVQKHR